MDEVEEARRTPPVGYRTYLVFLLFGVTSLIAWNTWITSFAHYKVVLKDSPYADSFQNYFAVVYMGTNLLCLCMLLFFGERLGPSTRLKIGLTMNAAVFSAAGLMTLVATKMNATTYFAITLVFIVISAAGAALVAGVFAFASQYHQLCTQAISTGQGFAGLVPAVTVWLLLFSGSETSDRTGNSATKSFALSAILTLSAGLGYYILPKPHSEEYAALPSDEDPEVNPHVADPVSAEVASKPHWSSLFSNKALMDKIKFFVFAMFLNFVVSLGLFPAVLSSVRPVTEGKENTGLFVATMFVVFNICDVLGKALPGFSFARIRSGVTLFTISLIRFVFIPLFFMCNVHRHVLPRVFGDVGFFVLVGALSSSGGWMATDIFMEVPNAVAQGEEFVATDIVVFVLALGLASGSFFSLLLTSL
ncbi:hypothetical protein HDU67_000811 [Dinochytrium kinnereticum]|nr:hypothetical protein HDU67_000811 [Dinochytrium kinnereticum]